MLPTIVKDKGNEDVDIYESRLDGRVLYIPNSGLSGYVLDVSIFGIWNLKESIVQID
jgi:hypothetical protein